LLIKLASVVISVRRDLAFHPGGAPHAILT
jgi:hypothetical protein